MSTKEALKEELNPFEIAKSSSSIVRPTILISMSHEACAETPKRS
jgi:hypothetical protein